MCKIAAAKKNKTKLIEYQYHRLANGIRLIHSQSANSKVAHVGLVINTGSRDELPNEHGIAHFIEHTIFKGTTHRKAYQVISCMENVGGEIDAYTTKEETCLYSSFLNEYYPRTLELFADIVFNSTFPEKELEKEKEVVIDEINSYKDSPSEQIFDDFEDIVFAGNALGRNILGTPESIADYHNSNIRQFMNRNYATDQMVICSVGQIDFKRLVQLAERYFGTIAATTRCSNRTAVSNYIKQNKVVNIDSHQAHCIIGGRALPINSDKRTTFELINNIIGGPGMNCRLNLALRERRGYTYNIESFFTPYTDTGIFGIYFGTDAERVEKCLQIIRTELQKICTEPLGVLQLDRAKKQMIGQLAMSIENYSSLTINLGRSCLLFDTIDSFDTVSEKVNSITATQILDVANQIIDFDNFSTLVFK